MYDTTLGTALNYGQSMVPGKSKKGKTSAVQAAINYRNSQQPSVSNMMLALLNRGTASINAFIARYNNKRIPR